MDCIARWGPSTSCLTRTSTWRTSTTRSASGGSGDTAGSAGTRVQTQTHSRFDVELSESIYYWSIYYLQLFWMIFQISRNDASYNANTGPLCANDAVKIPLGSNNGELLPTTCSSPNTAAAPSMDRCSVGTLCPTQNNQKISQMDYLIYYYCFTNNKKSICRYCGGTLSCDGGPPAKTVKHTVIRYPDSVDKRQTWNNDFMNFFSVRGFPLSWKYFSTARTRAQPTTEDFASTISSYLADQKYLAIY